MRTPQVVGPWAATVAALGAAVYVVRLRLQHGWFPSHDLYAYFLPNMLYAASSFRAGGAGLLWNPFQNCGQPFLSISQVGLLYPPFWLFLVLEPQHALVAVELIHLVIGGVGAYLLLRELAAPVEASLAGALAFEIGNTMIGLTNWTPIHASPYAWMPAALLCCERLLKAPSARRTIALAAVLAIAMLPGMPQTVLFICQLIALRALWELVTRRASAAAVLGALPLAVLLAFLLASVQLLPAAETAGESIRSRSLTVSELYPFGPGPPGAMWMSILLRSLGQPFMLIPWMLVGPALCAPATRRYAIFYAGAGLLYVGLACGPGTPLFDLYVRLPLGGTFRDPPRFFWVTGFCVAITAGLGCAALASTVRLSRAAARATFVLVMLPPLALVMLAHAAQSLPATVRAGLDAAASGPPLVRALFPPGAPSPWEWGGVGALLLATLLAWNGARPRTTAAAAVAGLLAQLFGAPGLSTLYHFAETPPFFASAPLLQPVRESLTPQDRVYLLHETPADTQFGFMPKTASLFRIPSILDYEPLVTARYANLSVMLRSGRPPRSLQDILLRGPELGPAFSRRLLDLTAARFLVVPLARAAAIERITPALDFRFTADGMNVYENPERLPRAYYVPQIEVVEDPAALLQRLANGPSDLRQVALVEQAPPSGFQGTPGSATAPVEFIRNDPEHLVLRVVAPARGFLTVTDQYFPGWLATVNGRPTPILRANYAFRVVEVPAGEAIVELRYRPKSVWMGAIVSALALACAVVICVRSRARPVAFTADTERT